MYNETLRIATLSLRLEVPWAWCLLSVLSFDLNIVCAGTNDYRMRGGKGQDRSSWKSAQRGEMWSDEHPLMGASSTCCSEDPPLLHHSAFGNDQGVRHCAGGSGGHCPGLCEPSSWKLCWWYLQTHLLLTLCCLGSRKIYWVWWWTTQVNTVRCPRAVLRPALVSNVSNGEEGRGWKERNPTASD